MRLVDADEILTKKHFFWIDTPAVFDHDSGYYVAGVYASDIEEATTIYAEPVRHGEWIPVDEEIPCDEWDCTACGERRTFVYPMDFDEMKELYKYCPNCGAKMDGGKENGK